LLPVRKKLDALLILDQGKNRKNRLSQFFVQAGADQKPKPGPLQYGIIAPDYEISG
jgi:hypothetical protein